MAKLAAICTTWFTYSHADVILTRWLAPRETDWEYDWAPGDTELSAVHVMQSCEEDDQAAVKSERHELPRFESIEAALCLGGNKLAVDGVLLIGEHGNYPLGEYNQKLYPRWEMFEAVVRVMRRSGRVVPVFLDKHLSWEPRRIMDINRIRRELEIPVFAGSVLPFCSTAPALTGSIWNDAEEAVCVFSGGQEIYGFHALEFVQSLIERRRGGERGVVSIRSWTGGAIWAALGSEPGLRALFESALAVNIGESGVDPRSRTQMETSLPRGFYAKYSNSAPVMPCAFEVGHKDGFRSFHVMLPGCVDNFSAAVRSRGGKTEAVRAIRGDETNFFSHFATLSGAIARFMETRREPHPLERNVLTSLTLAGVLRSLAGASEAVDETVRQTNKISYNP